MKKTLVLALILFYAGLAFAEPLLNVQGRLTNTADGKPVANAVVSGEVYDVASGGTSIITSQDTTDSNGVFDLVFDCATDPAARICSKDPRLLSANVLYYLNLSTSGKNLLSERKPFYPTQVGGGNITAVNSITIADSGWTPIKKAVLQINSFSQFLFNFSQLSPLLFLGRQAFFYASAGALGAGPLLGIDSDARDKTRYPSDIDFATFTLDKGYILRKPVCILAGDADGSGKVDQGDFGAINFNLNAYCTPNSPPSPIMPCKPILSCSSGTEWNNAVSGTTDVRAHCYCPIVNNSVMYVPCGTIDLNGDGSITTADRLTVSGNMGAKCPGV